MRTVEKALEAHAEAMLYACDVLHEATVYLAHCWGVDTPPDEMEANLAARVILIDLAVALRTESEQMFERSLAQ